MNLKNLNANCKNSCLVFSFIFIFLFSISFVSSSSSFGTVENVCLPTNTENYYIWLEDYFVLDNDEEVTLKVYDSYGERYYFLPNGYASLDLPCFDIANYFRQRDPPGDILTDVIQIDTLNNTCGPDEIKIKFDSDSGLDQIFTIEVRDDCPVESEYTPTPDYYTNNSAVWNNLIAYYSFDNHFNDVFGNYNASGVNYAFEPGFNNQGVTSDGGANGVFYFFDTLPDLGENFTISFWAYSNASGGVDFITNDLGSEDFEVEAYTSTFTVTIDLFKNVVIPYQDWFHVVLVNDKDSNEIDIYINGSYEDSRSYITTPIINSSARGRINAQSLIDEIAFFQGELNSSSVLYLYNSGSGSFIEPSSAPNLPSQNGAISNVIMNTSSIHQVFLNTTFEGWDDLYLEVVNPFDSLINVVNRGYSTLIGDYFDLFLYTQGVVNITSYERPYNFDVKVVACNSTPFLACLNYTFNVDIQGDLGNVSLLNPLEAYYNLGFSGSETFAGNYFFEYYDTITFSFPDSNSSGVLNSSFPYEYSLMEDPNEDCLPLGPCPLTDPDCICKDYDGYNLVYLVCDIEDPYAEYNFLGDLNISLECGNLQSYYIIQANQHYNQKVYLTACNSLGCVSDSAVILASESQESISTSQIDEISPSTSFFDTYFGSFGEVLPGDDLESEGKLKLFYVIAFVLTVSVFFLLFKISVKVAVWCSVLTFIITMFVFASQGYINMAYPVLVLILTCVFLVIKFIRGGS